jgi:hypothetical protein
VRFARIGARYRLRRRSFEQFDFNVNTVNHNDGKQQRIEFVHSYNPADAIPDALAHAYAHPNADAYPDADRDHDDANGGDLS